MKLPRVLVPVRARLETALAQPLLGSWPEDARFRHADQPAALGGVLIEGLHRHLTSARIAYLFVEQMHDGEKVTLAKVGKASALIAYLADFDFVLKVNWTAWRELTAEQRIALIDHELCHCGVDAETSAYVMLHHDIEEFGQIVRRWGFWTEDLEGFAVEVGAQLELLDKALPKRGGAQ